MGFQRRFYVLKRETRTLFLDAHQPFLMEEVTCLRSLQNLSLFYVGEEGRREGPRKQFLVMLLSFELRKEATDLDSLAYVGEYLNQIRFNL